MSNTMYMFYTKKNNFLDFGNKYKLMLLFYEVGMTLLKYRSCLNKYQQNLKETYSEVVFFWIPSDGYYQLFF